MPILSKPSSAARTALIYITSGAILDIWTGVWFAYLRSHTPEGDTPYYWCAGFFITGLVLMVLGFAVGQIGRSARHAELPPPEVTPAAVNAEQTAAARAPILAQPTAPIPGQVAPVAPVVSAAPIAAMTAQPAPIATVKTVPPTRR